MPSYLYQDEKNPGAKVISKVVQHGFSLKFYPHYNTKIGISLSAVRSGNVTVDIEVKGGCCHLYRNRFISIAYKQ